ncbi:hypothetical protein ABIC86_004865 [Paenibacillus sp. DS2363]|nr:hypothetical protein PAEAM_06110 [Paenibacillus sp. GM1FR]
MMKKRNALNMVYSIVLATLAVLPIESIMQLFNHGVGH